MLYGSVGRVGLRALLGSVAFTPLSLFAAGEQGVWLDNSIDYVSQNGPELIVNGDFSTNTAGWLSGSFATYGGTFASVGGKGLLTVTSSFYWVWQPFTTVVGRTYIATGTLSNVTGGSTYSIRKTDNTDMFNPVNPVSIQGPSNGTGTAYFTATATTTYLVLQINGNGASAEFDNISVKEATGLSTATLFQDAAGTTPVTGYEQFVGLRLDKSKSGVGTNGAKRINLLSWTEAFDNAVWVKGNLVTTGMANVTATADPLGGFTADKLQETTANAEHYAYQAVTVTAAQHTFSIYLKAAERTWATIYFSLGPATPTWFNLAADGSGGVGTVASGFTAASTYVGNGWYRCSITGTSTAATWYTIVNPSLGNNSSVVYAGTLNSGIYIWGADLRLASEAATLPTYQRITDTWYNTIPGNHAYQTTTTARAVLSARYNLLTYTEQFDNAAWTKFRSSVSANAAIAPDGTTTADKLIPADGLTAGFAYNTTSVSGVVGVAYTASVSVKAAELGFAFVAINNRNSSVVGGACINLTTGQLTNQGASGTFSVTNAGNGWWRIFCTATNNSGANYIEISPLAVAGSYGSYTGDGTSGIYIWGADLRVANESSALPAYQRVGAAVNGTSTSIGTPDYDTVGFPAYLRYDGGDWYQTNSIDFSAGATNPPLGPELVTNGDFSNGTTGWTPGSANSVLSVDAGRLKVLNGDASQASAYQSFPTVIGRTYKVQFTVIPNGTSPIVRLGVGIASAQYWSLAYASQSSVTFFFVATTTAAFFTLFTGSSTLNDSAFFDNLSVKELTDSNYAPDKMSVFTGVRQLNNSAYCGIVGLGATVNDAGSMLIWLRSSAGGGNIDAYSRGTTSTTTGNVTTVDAVVPPETFILTTLFDIGQTSVTNEMVLRMNGLVEACTGSISAGTGTFGNAAINIGQYNSSNFLNGREYETIVLGRAVTATELANTEGYMETQTFGKDMSYVYADELTTATGDLITAADGDQIYMTVTYQ